MTITNKYYSLSILNSKDEQIPCSNGSFKLSHGTEYKVMLTNSHSSCKANAKVYIDGKRVGYFRLESKSVSVIERPDCAQKARKLTFFAVNSEEGRAGGLTMSPPELGKIKVEIQKECDPRIYDEVDCWDCVDSPECDSIGGTALGRESNQKFYTASSIELEPDVYILEARMFVNCESPAIVPL
jgi:hypothetical protein